MYLCFSDGCCVVPEMAFAITHDYGVVWDLDWCPSGCNDDCYINIDQNNCDSNSSAKMGLLAIACSNGKSYVYAIPHPSFLPDRCVLKDVHVHVFYTFKNL